MPDTTASESIVRVLDALAHYGMLLKQDKRLPSVVGIVTGESLSGSWWSHPRAHEIFADLSQLVDHPDVQFTKLLSRKDTLVHRRLWPDLVAVGHARSAWQMVNLGDAAATLLESINEAVEPTIASGAPAKELLSRLLVVGRDVHTTSGRHATGLESWLAWSARTGVQVTRSESAARASLQSNAVLLGAPASALPWNR
jgi:hypothetical protein